MPTNAHDVDYGEPLVSSPFAALADSIGVDGRTATAGQRPDSSSLFPTGDAANQRTSARAARGGDLIAMLLPKTSSVLVIIPNTRIVSVPVVTVPVP